jgi:DNA-directed RNA polymerase specialized sigma subunit
MRTLLPERDRVVIYLSKRDKERIDEIATDTGISTSSYIRTQVIERIINMQDELQSQNWDIE